MRIGIGLGLLLWAGGVRGQEDASVTLECKGAPTKARPRLRLEGKATFPDGTVMEVTLYRIKEQSAGGRLVPQLDYVGGRLASVQRGKMVFEPPADGPGVYRAIVGVADRYDEGSEETETQVPKSGPNRRWEFELAAWGDDLASHLGPGLLEVDRLAGEALQFVDRYAAAAAMNEDWKRSSKDFYKEADALLKRLGSSEAEKLYPTAMRDIVHTIRNLRGTAGYFTFGSDGGYAGAIDYHARGKALTFKREEFSFDALRKDLKEAVSVAGREFALWILKDSRRAGVRPELVALVKEDHVQHPGVAPFGERLARLLRGEEDAEVLENDIRGGPAVAAEKNKP